MWRKSIVVFIFLLGILNLGFSQTTNNLCGNPTPFCTGQTMTFPASTNAGSSQTGPYYGCLFSQPNPAWFFMQIANSGPMTISMSAANDIDFICWGPFSSLSGACNSLTASNMQSCSYSSSATETCTIQNAVAGQFYIMLITNYSNQTQNITFNQSNASTSGAATTNCGIVCAITATNSGLICSGQSVTLSLAPSTSSSINSYTWSGPGSFSSTFSTNVISNITTGGTYTVFAISSSTVNNVPYTGSCSAVTTVSVLQYPTFSISQTSASICQGNSFSASVTLIPPNNTGSFSYNWAPATGAGVWQTGTISTQISPPLLPTATTFSTMVYSVTAWPTSTVITCPVTKTFSVDINNPLNPVIPPPPPLCDTYAATLLSATPGGGTWSANPAVSSNGLFTPAIAAVGTSSLAYAVSVGTCVVSNTQTISVSKYITAALSTSLGVKCVSDPPLNLMNIVQSTVNGVWSGTQVSSNIFTPSGLASGNYNLTYNTFSTPNQTVCPASTVLVVQVFNPPVPTISAIQPLCTNSGTVSLTATPLTGTWSGNSGVSANGIQTPSLNAIGTNTVVYTAGLGTCVASSSRTFHVSQFNTAALTGTVPSLCSNSNPVNLMSIVQNTNGSWSWLSIQNNTFNPSGLPTGVYTITYQTFSTPNIAPYAMLCSDSRTIAAHVFNPPMPNIVSIGPVCSSYAPIQLTVSPAIGTWVPSTFLSATGVFSPALSPIGNNVVQYVIGTNTCNSQQTKIIKTEAFVSAALTNSVSDVCTTSPLISLNPLTLNNQGTWSGPGVLGTNFSPAAAGAGTVTLTYNIASSPSGLCPDRSTLAVNIYSLATPAITQVGPYCTNANPVQLQVSPVGGVFGSVASGAINQHGIFSPAQGVIGGNIVGYSIAVGPCIAHAQATIVVEKFVSADFAKMPEAAYCANSLPFDLNSLVQNPGGGWSGSGVIGSMFYPSKANIGNNNIITYETNSYPLTLCVDTSAIRINVKKIPNAEAINVIESGCAPLEVSFTSTVSDAGSGIWTFGDGASSAGLLVKHVYSSPGTYNVQFDFSDNEALGCSAQILLKKPIKVYETPHADFSVYPEDISIANPEVTLTNLSTVLNNNVYVWTIDKMNQEFELDPKISFPEIGNYKITLLATTINGCKSEMTKMVEVKNDFNAFIPNSFTPNDDGINDEFRPVFSPYGLDTKTYELEVFDRWGHSLFYTKEYNKGWDGTLQNKGEKTIKQDSYIYKLRYRDLDGRMYYRTGSVLLLTKDF
jgi:gliding motility-associated-like protein